MREPHLEERFSKLRNGGYGVESPEDPKYNCIAFAVGNLTRWWQWMPGRTRGYYWPLPSDNTLQSWMEVFRLHGYAPCESADFEAGLQKVAIYVNEGEPTHVAKQDVESGKWISKLGRGKDISHNT